MSTGRQGVCSVHCHLEGEYVGEGQAGMGPEEGKFELFPEA